MMSKQLIFWSLEFFSLVVDEIRFWKVGSGPELFEVHIEYFHRV